MSNDHGTETLEDAESEFRRRLASKLRSRGYATDDVDPKIDELLAKGVKLRLSVDEIMNDDGAS